MVKLLPGIFTINFFVTSFGVIYTGSIPTSKFSLEKQKNEVDFLNTKQVSHILNKIVIICVPTSKFGLERQENYIDFYKFINFYKVLHIFKIIVNYLCLINIL